MELKQAFKKRATVRIFADRPVPEELITKSIKAALHAPAYNHLWEWGFIRINQADDRLALVDSLDLHDWWDREKLRRAFAHLPQEARKVYMGACPVQRTMMVRAPELIVVVYRTKRMENSARSPVDLNAHAAIWMAISYFLLSLAEDGLFSCTVPPGPTAKAKDLLDIPNEWEIAVLLPIGYPRFTPKRHAHPTDPSPFIHEDKFRGFSLPTTEKQMG